jgi:hypothetical protein
MSSLIIVSSVFIGHKMMTFRNLPVVVVVFVVVVDDGIANNCY